MEAYITLSTADMFRTVDVAIEEYDELKDIIRRLYTEQGEFLRDRNGKRIPLSALLVTAARVTHDGNEFAVPGRDKNPGKPLRECEKILDDIQEMFDTLRALPSDDERAYIVFCDYKNTVLGGNQFRNLFGEEVTEPAEYAQEYIESVYGELPDCIICHVDWEAVGNDLMCDVQKVTDPFNGTEWRIYE